jgi:hypothetical protein
MAAASAQPRLEPDQRREAAAFPALLSTGAWVFRAGRSPNGMPGPWAEGLSLAAGAIDGSRQPFPLLEDHDPRSSSVVGRVDNVRVVAGELWGEIRFASNERAQSRRRDLTEAQIEREVSIGYAPLLWERSKQRPLGDIPHFLLRKWQLLEISLVGVGADPAARLKGRRHPVPRRNIMQELRPSC